MGTPDRRKKKSTPPKAPAEDTRITVPQGHEVDIVEPSLATGVSEAPGGAWVAQLGVGSDELGDQVDALLEQVESLASGPRPQVILSTVAGQLAALFAPNNPPIIPLAGLLVWVLDAAALAGAPHGPALVQRILRRIHQLNAGAKPLPQAVYVHGIGSPRGRAVAELLLGLGAQVREPDPHHGTVLVTVKRPEGVVLTVLAGPPVQPKGAVDTAARALNAKKDAALKDGDPDRLHALEDHERADLQKRLEPATGEAPVSSVEHATRLNRLLLAAADEAEGDAAQQALYKELLAREIPVLLIVDPKTQAAALREFPGGVQGMAAYPDRASLLAAADDLGLSPGTFGAAEMVPEKLFGWAASHGHAVLLNVYRSRKEPLYVPIPPELVRTLAQGNVPPRAQKK